MTAPFTPPFAVLARQGVHHRDHGCPPHQELQALGPLHLEGTCMQARCRSNTVLHETEKALFVNTSVIASGCT